MTFTFALPTNTMKESTVLLITFTFALPTNLTSLPSQPSPWPASPSLAPAHPFAGQALRASAPPHAGSSPASRSTLDWQS